MTALFADARRAMALGAIALAAGAALAVVIHLAAAAQTREILGFDFAGIPATAQQALAICANNARKLAGILGLALILQSPWLADAYPPEDRPNWHPPVTTMCDLCVVGVLGPTFLAVAAGVGAYGDRMAHALLPHGPLEILAIALTVVLYLSARKAPLAPGRAFAVAATSFSLLAASAALETFVSI